VTLASTPVVVVGDPGSLTGEDVALLDRYARIRGGSIIFLPERRVAGPALRLFPGEWSERLVPAPDRVGPLQAGELLQATRLPLAATVVASAGETPVVVSTPLGNGRVIVSGAMDAWRYRAKAFDEFWRSLVLEAGQAGAALQIAPDALLAVPGARLPISVSVRSFEAPRAADVTVTVRCGDAVGKYGFHLRLRECDDDKIKRAAGEILERYGLSRRHMMIDEIATAKRNFSGDMVPSL